MSQRKLESIREVYSFANCLTLDGAPFNPQEGKLYEVINTKSENRAGLPHG